MSLTRRTIGRPRQGYSPSRTLGCDDNGSDVSSRAACEQNGEDATSIARASGPGTASPGVAAGRDPRGLGTHSSTRYVAYHAPAARDDGGDRACPHSFVAARVGAGDGVFGAPTSRAAARPQGCRRRGGRPTSNHRVASSQSGTLRRPPVTRAVRGRSPNPASSP